MTNRKISQRVSFFIKISQNLLTAYYVLELGEFRLIVQEITTLLDSFSKNVEIMKMQAIKAQNFLNSSAKQKELDQSQIQTKIIEKTLELDKLKVQVTYLQRVESEQLEVLDNYINQ